MKRLTAGHVFYHEDGVCLSEWFQRCSDDHKLLLGLEFHHSHQIRNDQSIKKLTAQVKELFSIVDALKKNIDTHADLLYAVAQLSKEHHDAIFPPLFSDPADLSV